MRGPSSAQVRVGPDIRRGVAELDGRGEVVGGIVVMRFGENALQVIDRVKAKLREVESSLPAGVTIVPTYDRSRLIRDAIGNLGRTLVEEAVVVSIVIVLFLLHIRSALVPILVLPIAVGILGSFQEWFADLAPWIAFNTAQGLMFQDEGAPGGELLAQLLVSGTIWLVVPFLLGLLRLLRAEPK